MNEREFLDNVWSKNACTIHGHLSRLRKLGELPELASIDAMLDHVERANEEVSIRAWFQNEAGAHESIRVTPRDGRRLYRGRGRVTIVVDNLDRVSEGVRALVEEVHASLGTPAIASCNAYASPPGARTVMHFDPQESFLLQLHGRKRWRYAACAEIRFPSHASNYYANVSGHEALAKRFPKSMPRTATQATTSRMARYTMGC